MPLMTYEEYAKAKPAVINTYSKAPFAGNVVISSTPDVNKMKSNYAFYLSEQQVPLTGGDPSMLVDYSKFEADPATVTAELLRKQYDDYVKRYRDSENALMNMTTYNNPGLVNEEIGKATGAGGYVQKAMDSSDSTKRYGMQKYGMKQTSESAQATGMQSNLARSTAVVDAENKIRLRQRDRNQQIATGVVPNAGRAYGLSSESGGG